MLCTVLEFLLDCFCDILPKLSKIMVTYPNSVKREQIGSILICPKLAKWISALNCWKWQNDQFENLYISSHREARNRFGQQVNIIERVPLGTPPQVVVMTLAHNHVTNLYLELQKGYCYQIWTVKATLYRCW